MLALLKMVSIKDWLYAGLIVALLGGFGWYTIHERSIGEAHEIAALKISSDKILKDTAAQTAALQVKATTAEKAYADEHQALQTYVSSRPVQSVRLCSNTNSDQIVPGSAGIVARNAAGGSAGIVIQQVPSGDSGSGAGRAGPNIGPMLIALGARADEVSATLREYQARNK